MPFTWSRTARGEFLDAIRWYESASDGLGQRFSRLVGEVLDQIAENPERFPFSPYGARHARIKNFPYCEHYIQRERETVIVAEFHDKRDPEELNHRY